MGSLKIPLMKQAFFEETCTRNVLADFIHTTDRFSMGEKCKEFEDRFAKWHGMKHGILVNSGASANLALLQSLKNMGVLYEGANVGFSAVTWSTNVMPIIQMGFKPIPIDCNTTTLNVMSQDIKDVLEREHIDCIFLTNVLGFCGDLDAIRKLCVEQDIILLEDNCESLGTEVVGKLTGTFSLGSTFSFFVGHHLSTIEGGMLLTDDSDLANMARLVRANGWDRNVTKTYQKMFRHYYGITSDFMASYTFYDLAFNMRPTEITGFLGCEQMKYLPRMITLREKNYLKVMNAVKENPAIIPQEIGHLDRISAFAIPFLFTEASERDEYLKRFIKNGIDVRPIIAGNITQQPFWDKRVSKEYFLPGADFIHSHGFYCANRPDFTGEEIDCIISSCKQR